MKIIRRLFLCSIWLIISGNSIAQTDSSCRIQISVLTCAPGEELYSLFGHTALRIVDSTAKTDILYNWGTFDFDEPGFYMKFMRGKLLYFVSTDNLPEFLNIYYSEGRSVTEQVLNLSCDAKNKIKHAVDVNMQGDNRFYKYDFLFDNCTTRIRDFIFNDIPDIKINERIVPSGTTFRNMIHGYLDNGSQPWSKLGIDILLGAKVDNMVTNYQSMFLPEYLEKGIDLAAAPNKQLVQKTNRLIDNMSKDSPSNKYTPLAVIGLISVFIFAITLLRNNWALSLTRFIDSLLIYLTGLLGLLMLFMWLGTDHIMCSNNYNLLWAFPFNVIAGFFVWKRTNLVKKYFSILTVITVVILITWFWLPQQLNIALIPFVLLMVSRYLKLSGIKLAVLNAKK